MTFLAPTALIGTLLLAIPILVHLFKPRKMRRTPFSSLRWLKQTHQRLSRRIQWHQWLLFLLRAGVVLLLVLALAKPLVGSRSNERPADRYIILDVGRSMGYETPGAETPLTQAQAALEKIVLQGRPGDRTALLVGGAAPRIVTGPITDAGPHLPALRAARLQENDRPITALLPLVSSLSSDGAERDLELVFVTDARRHGWRQDDIQTFLKDAKGVRVQIIDAGAGRAENAWIAGARLLDTGVADSRWVRVELACVGAASQERSLRLTGIAGLADDVQPVTLAPGQIARVDFKIPANLSLAGQTAELRLEPADALSGDDRWFLNLDSAWSLRVLLIEPADAEPNRGSGLFLRAGLEALADANHQAVRIVQRTNKSVAAGDLGQADLVLLAGVPELPDTALEALEQRVRGGAGALIFLGEGMNFPFYSSKLHRPLQPAEGLLPAPLHAEQPWQNASPGLLNRVRWTHPLFSPLRDTVLSDLQQMRFRKHAAWAHPPSAGDAVLAAIDDGEPALIDRPFGAGRVLIWSTTADDAWSDLPRRRAFVPLLDRMLAYLTGGGQRREFVVGQSAMLPIVDGKESSIEVVAPSGVRLTPRLLTMSSQRLLHLDELAEAGVYRVKQEGGDITLAVNVSRAASPLTPMDSKTLEAWWTPAPVEVVSVATILHQAASSSAWPLWPALIFIAGLLLLAETIYVHRLCPRSDPAAVESIVPQRTVLQPIAKAPFSPGS